MHDDDVAVALTRNHLVLSRLAVRSAQTSDRKLRNALFDDLAKGLGGHFAALERVVLPALLRARASLGSDVLLGAMALKRELAALLTLDRRTPEFEARLPALCEAVELQADREQLGLLPLVRQTLSPRERAHLAWEVTASMQSRLGDHPVLEIPARAVEPPRSIREALEQAAVVLSSLPGSAAGLGAPQGDEAAPA